MGLPLLKQAAEITGGGFEIKSEKGKGTTVLSTFVISSIDRVPLGNLAETLFALINNPQGAETALYLDIDGRIFAFDTQKIKAEYKLDGFEGSVGDFIKEYLKENIEYTKGGTGI